MNPKISFHFGKIAQIWYSQIFYAVQCWEERKHKKGRKIYAARDFSDKCVKLLIKSFEGWNKFSI